jgi:hypothetical protein
MGLDVLTKLQAEGITLSADGGNLVATPKAVLTDGLRSLIRANKFQILKAFEEGEDLCEYFLEHASIMEDAGIADAEIEAARSTTMLARNRGYLWESLWMAFSGYPELLSRLPDKVGAVDMLPFGVATVAVFRDRVVRQGTFSGSHVVGTTDRS